MQQLEEKAGVLPSTRHLVCGHLNPVPRTLTCGPGAWLLGPPVSERQTSQVTSTPRSRALSGSPHTTGLHVCDVCVCLCSCVRDVCECVLCACMCAVCARVRCVCMHV